MDFMHHDTQAPQQTATVPATGSPIVNVKAAGNSGTFSKWIRLALVALLFSITVMLVAIVGLIYVGNGSEARFVDSSKYQAVEISDGVNGIVQIYFGHVVKINDRFLVLRDIYYVAGSLTLRTSQAVTYTPTKLGCEFVGGYDQMVINRDHVVLWENLRSDGPIAKKIATDKAAHPNGPDCTVVTAPTSTSTTVNPKATTPTTTTTTKPTTTTATPTTNSTQKTL